LDGHFLSLMIMTCVLVFSAVVDVTFIVSINKTQRKSQKQ